MGKYFGTDGFRGEANVKLQVTHAFKIGRFLGNYYKGQERTKIVIGKDTRRSGDMFEHALCAGITASGADVCLLGVVPTPCVSYVVRTGGYACGIMISASHNPYYDNGIKIINAKGHKLEAEVEVKIEAYIDAAADEIPLAVREQLGRVTYDNEGREAYLTYLKGLVKNSFSGKRIGLDCANGSASEMAQKVFESLGAEAFVIHHEPDGENINEGCGSTHIEVLAEYVKKEKLDAGFAYDGDADRCLCVDNHGTVVDGDGILYICGLALAAKKELANNTVVTTIMSNLGLYKAFDEAGISYEKTAVGDKYVYENMSKNGHCLGGEQSGHIIFGSYATTGDGILTSLMLMEELMNSGKTFAQLHEKLTIFPQLLKNVRVSDKEKVLADESIQQVVRDAEAKLGTDGRILLRPSGTEPVIRVMAEATTDEMCKQLVDQVVAVIEQQGSLTK